MRLTVLGSGTLLPNGERASPAHLVQGRGFALLLDCGSGAVHRLGKLGGVWQDLTHVAITHFHGDHVGDLPALLWAFKHGLDRQRAEALTLVGPRGLRDFLDAAAVAFGRHVLDPGLPLRVVELPRMGRWSDPAERFTLFTHATPHTDRSMAYRIEAEGCVLGYTGDTGPDTELFSFLRGAQVVVCECAHLDPAPTDTHLTPVGVAELGRVAAPECIVTTHAYPPLQPERVPQLVREAGWEGTVTAGFDGLQMDLVPPHASED
jgi:ribonuclease BN (tRNA processing enzyme)